MTRTAEGLALTIAGFLWGLSRPANVLGEPWVPEPEPDTSPGAPCPAHGTPLRPSGFCAACDAEVLAIAFAVHLGHTQECAQRMLWAGEHSIVCPASHGEKGVRRGE